MFPHVHRSGHVVPLIAALAFLAHVHYSKAVHSVKWEHHSFTASSAHKR